MSNKWTEYKFGDLVFFPPKLSPPKNIEIPFIDMELVKPESRYVTNRIKKKFSGSASKFENKDVLFARITPSLENRKIAQAKINGIGFGSTEFFVFRAKKEVCDQNFLYYLAKTDYIVESAINSFVGASGRQRADDKFIKRLNVKIPNPKTQRKIAAILTAYDDLIENNNKHISILENMAEQIYKEWFVRMRFPGYKNTKFVKGIPVGWEVRTVNDLGDIVTGKTPSTKINRYFNGNYLFIKTPDMHNNIFVLSTSETLTEEGIKSQPSQTIPPNSLCVSCIGSSGVGSVSITISECQTNQQINSVILKKQYYREWAYYTLTNQKAQIMLYGSTGATMTNLSKGKFSALKTIIPDENIIVSFHNLIKPSFEEIKLLSMQNQKLTQTRDLLLPRLLSGKLSVENLDIKFPPSMENDNA